MTPLLPFMDSKLDHIFDPVLDHHARYLERVKQHHTYQTMTERDIVQRAKEYNTVRLGFGRQNGKSCWIARTAGDHDIIYCRTSHDIDTMERRLPSFGQGRSIHVLASTDKTVLTGTFGNIWVQDASYIDKTDLEWIYEKYADRCERFILIS